MRLRLIGEEGVECLLDGVGGEAASGEGGVESAFLGGGVESSEGGEAFLGEGLGLVGGVGGVGVGGVLGEELVDEGLIESGLEELLLEEPGAGRFAGLGFADQGLAEGGVVEEAELGEAVEDALPGVFGVVALGEFLVEPASGEGFSFEPTSGVAEGLVVGGGVVDGGFEVGGPGLIDGEAEVVDEFGGESGNGAAVDLDGESGGIAGGGLEGGDTGHGRFRGRLGAGV